MATPLRLDTKGFFANVPSAIFTPEDVLRELISNALQACWFRQAKEAEGAYQPRITVSLRGTDLKVTDNGCGISTPVIQDLGLLMKSKWSAQSAALGLRDTGKVSIGRFGMGITSAQPISRSLAIWTRDLADTHSGMVWETDWVVENEPKACEKSEAGTEVTVSLKSDQQPEFLGLRLEKTIRRFFLYVQVPIYLDGRPKPLNEGRSPWDSPEAEQSERLAQFVEAMELPHHFIPASPIQVVPFVGHASFSGLLWVCDGPYTVPTVYVYSKGVFVGEDRSLLPRHMRFTFAVVNDEEALIDITRKRLQESSPAARRKREQVTEVLQGAGRRFLVNLSNEYSAGDDQQQRRIRRFADAWEAPLKMFCLNQSNVESVLPLTFDWMPFECINDSSKKSLVDCTIANCVRYVDKTSNLQYKDLIPSARVVDATHPADLRLVQLYSAYRGVQLDHVADIAHEDISFLTPDERRDWSALLQVFRRHYGGAVEAGRFRRLKMYPAIMATRRIDIDTIEKHFKGTHIEQMPLQKKIEIATDIGFVALEGGDQMVVNVDNDAISSLQAEKREEILQDAVMHIIHVCRLLRASRAGLDEARKITTSLTRLLHVGLPVAGTERAQKEPVVRGSAELISDRVFLFCDIRNSTPFFAAMRSDVHALGEFYGNVVKTVRKTSEDFGGELNNVIGDGFFIMFQQARGAKPGRDACAVATKCGFTLISKFNKLRATLLQKQTAKDATIRDVIEKLGLGVGINHEEALFGSFDKNIYPPVTAVGASVSLACRTGSFANDGEIVVTDPVRQKLGDLFEIEEIGPKELKGFTAAIHLWRVVRDLEPK